MKSILSTLSAQLAPSLLGLCLIFCYSADVRAQSRHPSLDRVLTQTGQVGVNGPLAEDRGSTGLWQRLLKLTTTASILHTTAHPDDEHAGVLTLLGRGQGVRTGLLSLNRGEGGANALGAELFDALGLVRTEELLLSGRYYGLDDLYFTTAIDYGYSKTLDEALRSWDREAVLGEMVRVIRLNRPLVVVSRFHGSERDGHGHHQAVGGLTPEAVRAAGDPAMFPEQISEEGLRLWQPLKLYRGGVREKEAWHVQVDAGVHSAWLGTSYQNFGMYGMSLQRSQTSGRTREVLGAVPYYYERLAALSGHQIDDRKEADFFEGIDMTPSGIFSVTGETAPPEVPALLGGIERHVDAALAAFDLQDPSAVVPHLVQGLHSTRKAIASLARQPEARFLLTIKEQQFMEALNAALGVQLSAIAMPADAENSQSPWAPLPTMGVVVPGQTIKVAAVLSNPFHVAIHARSIRLISKADWRVETDGIEGPGEPTSQPFRQSFNVLVPEQAAFSRRYYYRDSIKGNQYQVRDSSFLHLPARAPALEVLAVYEIEGEQVEVRVPVRVREANLPYGYVLRELKVAPALSVTVEPIMRVVPLAEMTGAFELEVKVLNSDLQGLQGDLQLEAPDGWEIVPEEQSFSFTQAGEQRDFVFQVMPTALGEKDYTLTAVARANGTAYREGYEVVQHRDLETNYLYKPATITVRGLDVRVAPNLQVGYVMGVGDDVPTGIEQLGARVHLLSTDDLAAGDLNSYDAIVVGTRAYAVRQDLLTYNARLLEYAREGGHLIVLYQTPEFDPSQMAPYPAELPRWSEEVSEEDAPIRVLVPDHPVFQHPNRISALDFEGWVEQRGSKFFSSWDDIYTPLVESHDTGQAPQQGGWLMARHGEGWYTYFAYALHRQLPYAISGPYRIFANLLSLGQE